MLSSGTVLVGAVIFQLLQTLVILLYIRRKQQQNFAKFSGLEKSVFNAHIINNLVPLKSSIPVPGGSAAGADFLSEIVKLIDDKRPSLVVELGSGLSTIIIGLKLKSLGYGKLISVEHDEYYATMARERIAAHQIEPWVEVRTARLVPYPEHSSTTHWYDQAQIKDIRDIDLFIVDGPPMQVHRLIRAPSLSFFLERRTDDGMMIMDDSSRPGEQEILENWRSRYPNIIVKEIRLEKGAALISVPYNKSVTKISA